MLRKPAVLWIAGLLTLAGCVGPRTFDRADESVERAKEKLDESVDRAADRLEDLVEEAKSSLAATAADIAETTGAEVDAKIEKLQKSFQESLADLDRRSEERIEQIRSSAQDLVRQGDAAVQARIDQLFAELRRFSTETLSEIRLLIEPILEMAKQVGAAVENGEEHVAALLLKITPVLDSVKLTVDEVRKGILELRGRDPDTGEPDGVWYERGAIGLLFSLFVLWRKLDASRNGERWKPEELKEKTRSDVEQLLKSGEYDDEIRARLVTMGVLRMQPSLQLPVPPREGGDPSSPQGPGRAS